MMLIVFQVFYVNFALVTQGEKIVGSMTPFSKIELRLTDWSDRDRTKEQGALSHELL
jgi:hypothetical protein